MKAWRVGGEEVRRRWGILFCFFFKGGGRTDVGREERRERSRAM